MRLIVTLPLILSVALRKFPNSRFCVVESLIAGNASSTRRLVTSRSGRNQYQPTTKAMMITGITTLHFLLRESCKLAVYDIVVRQRTIEGILSGDKRHRNTPASRRRIGA